MLELGGANKQAGQGDAIREASEANFRAEVVEASQQVPVIVDFRSPGDAACEAMTPALEQAVTAHRGAVRLVKVNINENRQLAAQLRIQALPTVYAFWQGQPADGFQGAMAAGELKQFVDRVAALGGEGGDGGLAEALEAAEQMLSEGAVTDAAQTFAAILGEDPNNAAAFGGMARAHVRMGELDKAEALLANAHAEISGSPEIDAARAQLDLARQAAEAGPVDELRARIEADPEDHQARFDLAKALHANGEVQAAVDELLELFRRDRDWNDGAAKTQLFKIFDALKPTDPIAQQGRRRLSSMIFA